MAEQIQTEVSPLLKSKGEVPSLGVSALINLQDGTDRASFLEELQELVQGLAEKYSSGDSDRDGTEGGEIFRLIVACYPNIGND